MQAGAPQNKFITGTDSAGAKNHTASCLHRNSSGQLSAAKCHCKLLEPTPENFRRIISQTLTQKCFAQTDMEVE